MHLVYRQRREDAIVETRCACGSCSPRLNYRTMQLEYLLRALDDSFPGSETFQRNVSTVEITRVTDKSRNVIPGSLFVAYPGVNVDGAKFIPDAIERGAVAVVTQSPVSSLQSPVPIFVVPDGRSALAHLAAAFHNYPSR